MITTILIVLVAVVVLIVIIAVLALHFLRADDSDSFDDVPADPRSPRRSPADPPREPVSAGVRRSRPPEPAREQWANGRAADDRSANYRNRDTGPRPVAPDRRNGQPPASRPAAATARPAKSAKAVAEAKSNGWDSLSDVDYWAELSVDKPQVGPVSPAPAAARVNGAARRGPDAKPAGRPAGEDRSARRTDSGPIAGGPAPAGSLPNRPRSHPARAAAAASSRRDADPGLTEQFDARGPRPAGYGNEPSTQSLAALARMSGPQPSAPPRQDAGKRPASGQRSASGPRPADGQRGAGRRPPQSADYSSTPPPYDDDPLTSPSFPAINASDSRSYRARRSSGAHSGPHTGPQPGAGRSGGYPEPTSQYPAQPRTSPPQAPSSAPIANPYGSYVTAPQPTYGQQSDGAWYGAAATGYLPANGYSQGRPNGNGHNGNGHNGNGHNGNGHNGNGHNGNGHAGPGAYGAFDYQNLTYEDADYQQAQSMAGYAQQNRHSGQFDERSYGTPDVTYGQDGYQGYPGYGPSGR